MMPKRIYRPPRSQINTLMPANAAGVSRLQHTKQRILELDLRGCVYLNLWSEHLTTRQFFIVVSRLGDGAFWYAMLLVVWCLQGLGYSLHMLYWIIGSGFGTLIYKLLKQHTVRPRPYQVHQVIVLGERPLDHFSFPSGHTLHAVMASVILGYIEPWLLVIMLPFTLLVALSRMVLGLHYPSDVLVGAFIGASVAVLLIAIEPLIAAVPIF